MKNLTSILSISTNYDHWRHPFTPSAGKEQPETWKRVTGVVLLIFCGLLTFGGGALFILTLATWKHYRYDSVDDVVFKVQQLSNSLPDQGKKLCLFIGRQVHEELPKKEDEVWVSLDEQLGERSRAEESRLHLQVSIGNDWIQLRRLQRCFNKVVLDQSVLKFLGEDPWRIMGRLLKDDPESSLITESDHGCNNLLTPIEMQRYRHDSTPPNGAVFVPLAEIVDLPSEQSSAVKEQYKRAMLEETQKYLSGLFSKVEHITDKPYPYKTEYNNREGKDRYYVLQGPKVQELRQTII